MAAFGKGDDDSETAVGSRADYLRVEANASASPRRRARSKTHAFRDFFL
jgi:hypothetical protein